jgi:hypothetical protein
MNNGTWVEWMTSIMGGESRHSYAATFPPDCFYCLLDELPVHLVRRGLRRDWQNEGHSDRPLQLNRSCIICPPGELPPDLFSQTELLSGFALQGAIAWVRDEISGCLLPFWLGPEFERLLRGLHPGDPISEDFPVSAKLLFEQAGIVLSEERASKKKMRARAAIARAAASFREKGYAPVGDLIHPFHVASLRRYYRYMIRSGAIRLGDEQSSRRYVAHNEAVARFFHHQIAATFSAIAGEPLKPSYVYLASYLSGAELKKHTDREQCEFSITLCLDFAPEPELATPWPIRLDAPSGTVTVYQAIGDGLAYRGTRLPHYRGALPKGQSSTSVFFHYVPTDFSGSLE